MFRWAIIDCTGAVLRISSASMDVPPTRPFETWVIVPMGTKWKPGMIYNRITGEIEYGT